MKRFKTQCSLTHETTMKALGQRQTACFPSGKWKRHAPPPRRESRNSAAVRASTPARDSPGLGPTWCQEPGKGMSEHRQRPGTAGMPAVPHRTQHQTFKHCQRGSILKENSLGWREEQQLNWQGNHCSKLPTASVKRKEVSRRSKEKRNLLSGLVSPLSDVQNLCRLLPTFFLPFSNYAAGSWWKQNEPYAVTSVTVPARVGGRGELWRP